MMMLGTLFAFLLMAGPPTDVVVVSLPIKGSVSLVLTPSGKADIERNGTLSQIHIEVDKLQDPQKLSPAMNAYVVWAVSPEGGYENVGELGVADGKGRLDATTRFDQFGILITAEPYFMVDRPNSIVAFRNQAPKAETIRHSSASVEVGFYDYSKLQPVTAGVPAMVAQARIALQVAAGVQADRYAESEFRLARVDLGTVEDMLGRSAPMDLLLPVANESIRMSQKAFVDARENASSSALESALSDATLLRRDTQQLQDRYQQLTGEHTAALDQIRQLNADLAGSVRDKQQAAAERDAALVRIQGMEKDLADLRRKQDDLQNAPALKLPAEYFDIPSGALTAAGSDALAKIAAAAGFWSDPVRIACPKNAVDIVQRFLSMAGVPQNRVVIVPDR
jgi:hypothetical protein